MLALVGSGEYLPPIEPVDRYLLAQINGEPSVACLATAAGTEGDDRIAYWSTLGVSHFSRLGAKVEAIPIVDKASAHDPALVERLRRANFIYLSGGKPDYLHRVLLESPAWQAILDIHNSGGIVCGCSAGAMILGEKILRFPGISDGFKLLSGVVIMPHFDELPRPMLSGLRLTFPKSLVLVGIDGNTALVCQEELNKVVGMSGVTIIRPGAEEKRYKAGETVELTEA